MVANLSESGARVVLGAPTLLPEDVVLWLGERAAYPARRRWIRGVHVGLEFTGAGHAALRDVRDGHLAEAAELLRAEHFFRDPELRGAVVAAQAAHARLEAALRPYAPAAVEA